MEGCFPVQQRAHLTAAELEHSPGEEVHRAGGAHPSAASQDEVRGRDSRPGRPEALAARGRPTSDGPAGLERPDQLLARHVHIPLGGNGEG